ncbi:MAG: ABC transporter substrate-binding protein [Lachnospiraceae bacterium]|nr:ABC transporter substrate-binding protein [Lachnospiraceae bacterium]
MRKKWAVILAGLFFMLLFVSCQRSEFPEREPEDIGGGLVYDHSLVLSDAKEFTADYYDGGYVLLTIAGEKRYLLVPEETEAPEGLSGDIVQISCPVKNVYLVASAAMDMFAALDAMDALRFSGLKAESWYIDEAREAMEKGTLLYAGKYSAPDYEQILSQGCGLAVENTMIYHSPEVLEQLEAFDIPVLVDYSSYEETPLGRMEWVKLYGLLTGKEEEAKAAFEEQAKAYSDAQQELSGQPVVAFFYITSNGEVNVRRASDYLPKMIEAAGGTYFLGSAEQEASASSTMSMQMEEFYSAAKDADYLIYNSTIDGELSSVEDLLNKSGLLKNFRAVQSGQVFCTSQNLYQSSMQLGTITADMHRMLTGDMDGMTYLYRLE